MRPTTPSHPRLRVMHVASGGFSGATQVALDLTRHATEHDNLLLLRRKRRTPMERVDRLQREGVPLVLVPGWSHLATVRAVADWVRRWRPDVIVGHGFPEHLLARWGAWWAHPPGAPDSSPKDPATRPIGPAWIQVEHNARERYTAFKRWQARRLAPHTAAFVGVSEAVAEGLRHMGLPAGRVRVIHNGISLSAFEGSEGMPWHEREAAILMAARFGGQKDHETLIRALIPLREHHGLEPMLRLAGGGSARHRQAAEQLVQSLGLERQVEFLGHCSDLPQRLMRHRVAALSTHYEGMGLVLAEGMAAGCAVVGSDVAAVREVLGEGQWGWLARRQDPQDWARVLAPLLSPAPSAPASPATDTVGTQGDGHDPSDSVETGVGRVVDAARVHARTHFAVTRMVRDYETLYAALRPQAEAPPRAVPWLSVLMPAHNAQAFIGEALQSVISQVGPDAEVVVLDDGSTDATPSVLASIREQLADRPQAPALRLLRQESARGVSAARNRLLEAARGRWLWFLDADDRLRPGAVGRVRSVIARDDTLQAVVVDHAVWRERPRLKHRLRGEGHRRSSAGPAGLITSADALMHDLLARAQWHPWGRVIRRDAWPPALRFPEGRCFEDLAVIPQLMAGCQRTWVLREPLVDYRSNPGSILGTMNPSKVADWAQALHDLADAGGGRKIPPPGAVHSPAQAPWAPQVQRAWNQHLAVQMVRLSAVARRLGVPPERTRAWWLALAERAPGVPDAIRGWIWQPRRWGLLLKARQGGAWPWA